MGVGHQLICTRLLLLMQPLCPAEQLVMLDTWWCGPRGKVRADVGIYERTALPRTLKDRVFRVPPRATIEVLSDDASHDLHLKHSVYADSGARRAYIDPYARTPWLPHRRTSKARPPTGSWTAGP